MDRFEMMIVWLDSISFMVYFVMDSCGCSNVVVALGMVNCNLCF